MHLCMFSCCYENASLANYSCGLISSLENSGDLDIRLIASPCRCLERFPNGKSTLIRKCVFVNYPHLNVHFTRIGVLNIAERLVRGVTNMLRGLFLLQKCKDCDLIHYQQSSNFSFGFLPLIPIILFSSQKKIVTLHSTDEILGMFPFLYRFYSRVDKIIVHSDSMRIHLIKKGVPESKIIKIHHGVNIPNLFGLKRKEVTFFGAPEERKGIHTILDALKILKSKNVNIKMSIYGLYSDFERRMAESFAESRGVNESLVWGGRLTEIEFDEKLQQSLFTIAVYTLPISGSNLVTRAMANATPVIATDVGGLKEYLDGGGIVLKLKNPEDLADAMELLLKNAEMREKLGAKGRERALNLLSWGKVAEKTFAIYENILAKD